MHFPNTYTARKLIEREFVAMNMVKLEIMGYLSTMFSIVFKEEPSESQALSDSSTVPYVSILCTWCIYGDNKPNRLS